MSEREYPVPGYPDYTVRADGAIISYRKCTTGYILSDPKDGYGWDGKGRRTSNRVRMNVSVGAPYRTFSTQRIALAAKLGRLLEPWEEVRHIDGDFKNNCLDNLEVGDHLNNIIDDLTQGKRETSLEYLDEAIARLMDLRAEMEQEKSPSE